MHINSLCIMKSKTVFSVLSILLLIGPKVFAQQIPVKIKLSVIKSTHTLPDGLFLNIRLTSNSTQKLKVHSEAFFRIKKTNSEIADGYFEVKPFLISETDSSMQGSNDCDYGSLNPDKVSPYKNLTTRQYINYHFDLGCYYHLIAGHIYKIRFYYKLSRFNPTFKDLYSEWLTIKI
jgi:hypothetical protein